MKVVGAVTGLQKQLDTLHHKPVGLVPTMGALHEGHLSLVRNAVAECGQAVISIYVNPTQFNDKEDLKRYPRTPEADLALLGTVLRKNDLVFTPDDKEIYPTADRRVFHFGNLDRVMEAQKRPGHFNGVAQVVSRLFDIVKPDIAYFGQKDFQQVAVIRELVRQLNYHITISPSPIIRESDGLAMSSRNRLLEPEIRKNAPVIYKTISTAAEMIGKLDIPEIKKYVNDNINIKNGFKVEYFEIADETELKTVKSRIEMKKGKKYYGCIAVKAGKIRLIDNVEFPLV
ncbi:MAG: pantoate--beta-alanine ligase [Bacteroidales bacterium]